MIAEVIVLAPLDKALSYRVPGGLAASVGDRVRVPLGSRTADGVIVALREITAPPSLKPLIKVHGPSGLDPARLAALRDAAAEFLTPPGPLFALALPPAQRGGGNYLRLVKRGETEPLALLAVRPLFTRPVERFETIRKKLGPARYEREIVPLVRAGWIETLDERPRAQGLEPWLRWRADAPPLPARRAKSAPLRSLLGDWTRREELLKRIPGAATSLAGLVKAGFVEVEKRPQGMGVHESLAVERTPGLSAGQAAAAAPVLAAIAARAGGRFLLQGPTGSGKTAVYLSALKAASDAGRPGLLLVPEINLIPQTLARLRGVFGDRIAVFHSEMAEGARAAAWSRVASGNIGVAVGVRSGIFAPLNPGVIVIDEEQESSYRQPVAPAYSARALALRLAADIPCPLVLVSATPSIESRYAARDGGPFTRLALAERAGGAQLPETRVLDMRGMDAATLIHPELLTALREVLARGEKALLLRNRRGWAPQLLCRTCGSFCACDRCSVAQTLHREAGRESLVCHLCGDRRARPVHCPGCGGDYLQPYGAGTQRLLDTALELIPEARPLRLDRDSARGARGAAEILRAFRAGEANLLVGTQMLAKGHDIPGVTVVGVLAADGLLGTPDYRASERLFALLTQAIGRAGRAELPGRAFVQALNPDHYAVRCALAQDYEGFYAQEIKLRRLGDYPPFGVLSRILCTGEDSEAAWRDGELLAGRLNGYDGEFTVLGPAFCPLERIEGRYRVQIILKARARRPLADRLRELLPEKLPAGCRIEMDPENLS